MVQSFLGLARRPPERDLDLIITELRMPGVDGMALHRWLAEARPELAKRVVLVTGDRISTAIDIALRETGRPVLAKRFAPADARRVLRAVVGEACGPPGGRLPHPPIAQVHAGELDHADLVRP